MYDAMEALNVAVIGLGHWGPHYLRIFSQMPQTTVTVCCDSDQARLREVSKMYPLVPTTIESDLVFDSPEVDAVVIATPASSHVELASAAIDAGKDILVEKPITLDVESGVRLVHEAEQKGRVLMVGHTFLYNPGILKVREIVNSDDFGNVYYMQATRTHLGLIRDDVDVLWDLAPHDISIFSFLLGESPVGASATGASFLKEEREDVGFVTLFYPGGIIGNIHASWIDSNKERRVVIVGSNKRVVFNDLDPMERVRIFEKGASIAERISDYGEFQLLLRDGDIISPRVDTSEPLKNMCGHFIECVTNRSKPLTDGKSGVEVVAAMKAVEESLAGKGCYVEIKALDT